MSSRLMLRRRLVIHSRRVITPIGSVLARAKRVILQPVDRRRSPAQPVAVVTLVGQTPEVAARFGDRLFASYTPRFATASEVVWDRPDRLMAVYLLTSTLAVFDIDDSGGTPRVVLRSQLTDVPGLHFPTSLAASPAGSFVAVTNSDHGSVAVFDVDADSGEIRREVAATVSVTGDRNLHGLAVAPDGRFVMYTTIDAHCRIHVARLDRDESDGTTSLQVVATLEFPHRTLRPKGIAVTPDGRFVVIAFGANVGRGGRRMGRGFLETRRYDAETGMIGEVVSRSGDEVAIVVPEPVTFFPDTRRLVVTDQVDDSALVVEFDPHTGRIGGTTTRISWAAGGLSFPHGCAVSPDGRWIAITNYGDGSIRFFASHDETAQLATA